MPTPTNPRRWTRLALAASCLALLCLAPQEAQAIDPRLPVIGAEPGPEQKVDRFRVAQAADAAALGALDQAALDGVPVRDRIHRALLVVDEEYAAAYAGYEETGDNAEAWRVYLTRLDKDQRFRRAHGFYFLGRALLAQDRLQGAAAALDAVRGRFRLGTPWTDEATLYLAYTFARLPEPRNAPGSTAGRARYLLRSLVEPADAEEAEGWKPAYRDVPERVQEGARWLARELSGEGMGPLLELAKRMETIERLIDRAETGEDTQRRQEEVVATLDRLIELMREREQGGGGGGGGQGNRPGPPQGNQRSGGPAQQSQLPGGDSRMGPLTEGPSEATVEQWGNLGDREREEAIQFLRERFPSRYREIIERYYRAVSEADN